MNLEEILKSSNSYLDLEYALPIGTDLDVRKDFANQALREAANLYRFPEFNQSLVCGYSGATVTVGSNFRELIATPRVEVDGTTYDYPEITLNQISEKEPTDKYCYVLGSTDNYNLIFNNLSADATLTILFSRFPSGMATLTDVCELPDAEYIKEKVISYVLQSRSDARFPQVDASANAKLRNMVGRNMIQRKGGMNRTPKNISYSIS